MKKPICTIKHFIKLQKFFRKVAEKVIVNDEHIQKNKLVQLFVFDFVNNDMYELEDKLLHTFKLNQYKTRSVAIKEYEPDKVKFETDQKVRMYLSYTVEKQMSYRRTCPASDSYLVFRIYMKTGSHRKQRLVRCRINMNWIKEEC